MRNFQARGLVIGTSPMGEIDRLVTLYTCEQGKIKAKAPGARKIKSKLAAGVDMLTCSNFSLYRGRTMATITQVEPEFSFPKIRGKVKDYALGMFFSELVDKVVEEEAADPFIFELMLGSLHLLNESGIDREILKHYFTLKLLFLIGYTPHIKDCINCGEKEAPFYWHLGAEGFYCEKCSPANPPRFKISRGTHALARRMIYSAPGKIITLRGTKEQKEELGSFIHYFLHYWIDPGAFKTLSFLKKIEK